MFGAHSRPKVVVPHDIGRIECVAPLRIFPRDVAYGYIEAQKVGVCEIVRQIAQEAQDPRRRRGHEPEKRLWA